MKRFWLLPLLLLLLGGCSEFSEGDKVFIDVTEGGIEHSAFVEASVINEAEGSVTVHIDKLECEADCDTLDVERIRQLRSSKQSLFPIEKVQHWESGKATYDKRLGAYRALRMQRDQTGIYYRVEPPLLDAVRVIMKEEGYPEVLSVIALADLERQFFTNGNDELPMSEVLEAFPLFLVAFKQKLEEAGNYQTVRRLRTEADLPTLSANPDRYYLTVLFHELTSLQDIYMNYLLPEGGDDMDAMAAHFRSVDPDLADNAGRALADFYSDNCEHLPAGMDCEQYRSSFKQRAIHRLGLRLKENLAKSLSAKNLGSEAQQAEETLSIQRFIQTVSLAFPEQSLLSSDEIDWLVRENVK